MYLKSPVNYIGGKYKLLSQIIPRFPKDIRTFVDLFAGSCTVGINVEAESVYCNDMNFRLMGLFRTLYTSRIGDVLNGIHSIIDKYGLTKTNERGFLELRTDYNLSPDPLALYVLSCYAFNYQIRFNNDMEFNGSFGRDRSCFSTNMCNNLVKFMTRLSERPFAFTTYDFPLFPKETLGVNDFVYCDPPYLISTAPYNDGNRGFKNWSVSQDTSLFLLLDELHRRGIRFALSNMIEHKGQINEHLSNWSKRYRVTEIGSDYSNSNYQSSRPSSRGSREVLITNY